MTVYCSYYETSRGVGGVMANDVGLVAVVLPLSGGVAAVRAQLLHGNSAPQTSALSEAAAELMMRYFAGEKIVCNLPLDEREWTVFRRQVYGATMAIPYGEVRGYGELALICGHPGAARAVGQFMATNRLPVIIPCHRVVAASGALTGYSAPGGLAFKADLLQLEGVALSTRQRVCW
jgi:methylated-DNA-[protein]-cysteine S-methyltransferase